MAKTVMQRITELIDAEEARLRPLLWNILNIEKVYLAQSGGPAKDKIQNEIHKFLALSEDDKG